MIKQINDENIKEINKRVVYKKTYNNIQREQIAIDVSEAMLHNVHFFELENSIYDYKNMYQKVIDQMEITIKGKLDKIVRDVNFEHENTKLIISTLAHFCYDVATRHIDEDDRQHVYVKWNTDNVVNILDTINNQDIENTFMFIYENYKNCFLNSNRYKNLNDINIKESTIYLALIDIYGYKKIYTHYILKSNIYIDSEENISYSDYMNIPYYETKSHAYKNEITPKIQIFLDEVINEDTIVVKGEWGKAKVKIDVSESWDYENLEKRIHDNEDYLIDFLMLIDCVENNENYYVQIWKGTEIYNCIHKYLDNLSQNNEY